MSYFIMAILAAIAYLFLTVLHEEIAHFKQWEQEEKESEQLKQKILED